MLQISRACAAIDILNNYINGIPIEKALKEWFKNNRFAGSNDRRSIRDIIFDILRKRLILFYPFQINDYSENGRILVLSYLYIYKRDTFSLFDIVAGCTSFDWEILGMEEFSSAGLTISFLSGFSEL